MPGVGGPPRPSAPGAVASGAPPSWQVWSALWVIYLVWGSTYLAIRVVVDTMPALLSGAVRFLVAGAVVWLVLAVRRSSSARITWREAGACTIVGTLLLVGGNGLVSVAEEDVPSGLAALIIACVPLVVIILRATAGHERVARASVLSVVIGFAGVALLLLPGEQPDGATIGGLLLCVAAAASWASGSFLSPRLSLPKDPILSTGVQMVLGGAVGVAAGLLRGEGSDVDPSAFSTDSLLALAYLITFGSWLAFTCYVWLLQNAPISKVATYAYVNPVVAIALGALILDETITPITLIGALIIVGSVMIVVRKESGGAKRAAAARDA